MKRLAAVAFFVAGLALVAGVIALFVWLRRRADLRARVARAFAVLRHPARYLRTVATWQVADWCLRLATIWFFLGALLQFTTIEVSNALKPTSPSDFTGPRPDYTGITWFHGITMGIAEIFFQDNWVTGIVILIGIAINTRIGAAMALMGSVLAVASAVFYGAHDHAIRDGLFGYNAALTAMALGGMFLVLNWPGFIYTVIGVLVTARVWASLGIFLEPTGMPVLTSAFVFVTWLMLLAKNGFPGLIPVAPADAITPEKNLARYRQKR